MSIQNSIAVTNYGCYRELIPRPSGAGSFISKNMGNRNMENRDAIHDSLLGHEGDTVKDKTYWETADPTDRPSTMQEFKSEVMAKIGVDFDNLPEGNQEDMIGGASLLAFEDWRVIGVGHPDEDPQTGEETYTKFMRIDMAKE